jgi:hypothetical protein
MSEKASPAAISKLPLRLGKVSPALAFFNLGQLCKSAFWHQGQSGFAHHLQYMFDTAQRWYKVIILLTRQKYFLVFTTS